MEVEVGDEVVVVGRHHAHVLGLPQHRDHVLHVAVQDNVDLTRLFHLPQDPSEIILIKLFSFVDGSLLIFIIVLEIQSLHFNLDISSSSGCYKLLEPHQSIIILI